MGARSNARRRRVVAATSALILAACGGGSGESTDDGNAGQAGVVLDTAPSVESAVVVTTTPAAPSTTAAPVDTVEPVTTPAPTTAPDTTAAPTTAEPVTTPATTDAVSTGVPVGYRPVFDDSSELQAHVPAEWIEVDGAPQGEARQLAAAADLQGFLAGYTLPGLLLVSGDAATPDAWMGGLSAALDVALGDGCTVSETVDYDDGVYTGTEHVLSCGSADTVPHMIGGRDEEGELFFLLIVVRPADDLDVRDNIVQSFFVD